MKDIICLGIESTAHTFGVGIIDEKGNVLANVKDSFTTESGGFIPAKAADHHVDVCDKVIKQALDKAALTIKDIELISFSQAPGIGHCLRIGAFAARSLSLINDIPLIGINHCIAHLSIGEMMTGAKDPVLLYASGANTQIIAYEAGKYRIFGESLDGGVGNFIDTFARYIGLGFPGGSKVYELSLKAKDYINLPYVVKGMDVSFGGILTNLKQKYDSGKYSKEDLCYSLQETVFAMLLEVSERAMAHCGKKELLYGGGVCCNKRLQEMGTKMCEEKGYRCFIPEIPVLVDNGLMIAWQGILEHKAGKKTCISKSNILPYQRTDDVKVSWK